MTSQNFNISVIITTFNRRQILDRAINSVLNQTNSADEIIVLDDGSTDGTDQLISQKFPPLIFSFYFE